MSFVAKLLVADPEKRYTPDEALKDPWVTVSYKFYGINIYQGTEKHKFMKQESFKGLPAMKGKKP
jgi:hypothetical protein